MTEAVFDFAAINRRMNRKPEVVAAVEAPLSGVAIMQKLAASRIPPFVPIVATQADIDQYRAEFERMKIEFFDNPINWQSY
jgi:hypothetical protein